MLLFESPAHFEEVRQGLSIHICEYLCSFVVVVVVVVVVLLLLLLLPKRSIGNARTD